MGIARQFVANRPPFIPGLKSGVFPAVSDKGLCHVAKLLKVLWLYGIRQPVPDPRTLGVAKYLNHCPLGKLLDVVAHSTSRQPCALLDVNAGYSFDATVGYGLQHFVAWGYTVAVLYNMTSLTTEHHVIDGPLVNPTVHQELAGFVFVIPSSPNPNYIRRSRYVATTRKVGDGDVPDEVPSR